MEKSETIGKLMAALSKVQASVPTALKDSDNPFFKSKYADLSSVGQAAFPLLGENGLSVAQIPGECADKRMSLYTVIGHSSGEWIGGEMSIPLPKFDPQAYGSALTYARRYALGSFVGVVTDDDDGNAASQPSENAVANDKPTKRENWGGRFPNKTSLHQALGTVDHNLRGCGDIDELEAYLATDEYKDFVKIAGEKAPHYLHGGDPAPEEFVGIFDLEKTTRDELSQKEAA